MVRRSLRAAIALLPLLTAATAVAVAAEEPTLIVRDDKRRLEISEFSLDYHDGQVRARVTSARGGTIDGEGTWRQGRLHLQLTARDLAAEEADPWMLRAGPLPEATGKLSGEAALHWEPGQPVRIDASLKQDVGDIRWVGIHFHAPIESEGAILIGGGTVLQDLRTRAAEATFGDLGFKDVSCVVQLKEKQLRLEELRGRGYLSDWSGEVSIDFAESEHPFHVAMLAKDEPGEKLYEIKSSESDRALRLDHLDAAARVSGRWTGDDTWRDTLNGSGMVRVRGGEVVGSPILPAVWKALAGRVPLLKVPSLPKLIDHPNPLIDGHMSFEVNDGAIHSEDVDVKTGDYLIEGSAHLAFDGTIDAPLVVSLTQEGAERMITLVALPLPKSSLELGRIPVRVTGTWAEPEASAQVEKVPLSMLKMIFGYHLWP
jgi:hypothetical protein